MVKKADNPLTFEINGEIYDADIIKSVTVHSLSILDMADKVTECDVIARPHGLESMALVLENDTQVTVAYLSVEQFKRLLNSMHRVLDFTLKASV